jgi:hypothetical protein
VEDLLRVLKSLPQRTLRMRKERDDRFRVDNSFKVAGKPLFLYQKLFSSILLASRSLRIRSPAKAGLP